MKLFESTNLTNEKESDDETSSQDSNQSIPVKEEDLVNLVILKGKKSED